MKSLTLLQQLETIRFIGYLPGTIPLQKLIMVVDALLASPVLAVVVDDQSDHSRTLLSDLRARPGHTICIGTVIQNSHEPIPADFGVIQQPDGRWTPCRHGKTALFHWSWATSPNNLPIPTAITQANSGIIAPLWLRPEQTMAETITLARSYNRVAV